MTEAKRRTTKNKPFAPLVLACCTIVISVVGFAMLMAPDSSKARLILGAIALVAGVCVTMVSIGLAVAFRFWRSRLASEPGVSRKTIIYLLLAWIGVGATATVLAPSLPLGWVVLNVTLLQAFTLLSVLAHELGHALSAWLLNLRVFGIQLGRGRMFYQAELLGTRLVIADNVFAGGATFVGHPDLRWYRLKHFLIVLAGPLTSAALFAFCFWLIRPQLWSLDLLERPILQPGAVLVWASLLAAVAPLIPRKMRFANQDVPSDIVQLCVIPFLSRTAVEQRHASYFAQEAKECCERGQWARAAEWHERGLKLHATDLTNLISP